MSNLWYDFGGTKIAPAIDGLQRSETPNRETLSMGPGNKRHYVLPIPRTTTLTFTLPGATEAEWATWRSVARLAEAGVVLTEPDGTQLSVVLTSFDDPIDSSDPTANAGTLSATGTVERNLTLVVETYT